MLHIGYDMCGQDNDTVLSQFADQLPETHTLLRIQPRRRLIQNQKLRIIQYCLCNPQPLFHAPGISTDLFICHMLQIDLRQQLFTFPPGRGWLDTL